MSPGVVIASRFILERLAGSGGMGAVWRARDTRTDAPVAVKLLHPYRGAREDAERLAREARVLAGVRHPGVVRYIQHGRTDEGVSFLVMEWLDGVDLAARLSQGALDVDETLALLAAVAEALAAVHARGIVHRDLKPQNVFLVGGALRAAKLVDFGIARWDDALYAMTRTGVVLGTPLYMAPEQARGARDLDARVDVFALGCIAYECLVGRAPFAADSVMAVLTRLALHDAPRVRALRPDIPDDVDDLVAAMLARDPAQRISDGAALRAALLPMIARRPAPHIREPVAAPDAISARELPFLVTERASTQRDVVEAPPTRTLLGRATPFVGRDRELRTLCATWDECVADGVARAVLVTGPAGSGKSRLRREWLRVVAPAGPTVLVGKGDPMRAGAPYDLLGGAMRRALSLDDDADPAARQSALRARVAEVLAGRDAERVALFLGELVGAGFADDVSPQLYAARRDARLMGDQVARAFEAWLSAECARRPVALVLDDAQWGDRPSLDLVDAALQGLRERPLMVLALARPEVSERFPSLWAQRAVQEVPLGELSRRASERLVRAALDDVDDASVERVIERAGGNAFLIEELVRAVSEGRGEALPESVRAVAHARLEALDVDARRVLRAASVFGRAFRHAGVAALLGVFPSLREALDDLVRREVLQRRGDVGDPGRDEYVFRHDLLREAAYAMLPDVDRALGHRLAGAWLERAGEADASVLAEHAERGGEVERAIALWLRAGRQSLRANDVDGAAARAARGLAAGARDDTLAALNVLLAESLRWQGHPQRSLTPARDAVAALRPGTTLWFEAVAELTLSEWRAGDTESLPALAARVLDVADVGGDTLHARARAVSTLAGVVLVAGRSALRPRFVAWADRFDDATLAADPLLASRVYYVRSAEAHHTGDTLAYLHYKRALGEACDALGDRRNGSTNRDNIGYALTLLGCWAEADAVLRAALLDAESLRLDEVAAGIRDNLAIAQVGLGRLDEARALEQSALRFFVARGNHPYEVDARFTLGTIELRGGDAAAAVREARAALAVAHAGNPQPRCQALLARALLATGRADEALALTRAAVRSLAQGGAEVDRALVCLAHAEALHARGEVAEARAVIADARARILARADRISDVAMRESFLSRVVENERTLALAEAWRA